MPVRACVECQIAILESTNRRRHHSPRQSSQGTIRASRGRISHIRQPEEEELWLPAEIATDRRCRTTLTMSVDGGKADIVLGRAEVRKYPNSDMAAYPNSNQRALMIIPKSVATYWI
jgi:hypothetical protein